MLPSLVPRMSDSGETDIRGTFFMPWMSDSAETDNYDTFFGGCSCIRFSRIGQFVKKGQRTRKTMMMIMAKPVRSVKVNASPVHATAVTVAMTGSLVPSMVARTAPTRITPAM